MSNTCKTCRHANLKEINLQLIQDKPVRHIASQLPNTSYRSVARHKNNCMSQLFADHDSKLRGGLLGKVDSLEKTFLQWLNNPKKDLQAGKLLIDLIDKEAKLTGAYQQDRSNETDAEMERIKGLIESFAQQRNMEYADAARYFFENIAHAIGVKADLRQRLLPE